MPLEDRRLVCATSKDKECTPEGVPYVGHSEIDVMAVCWGQLSVLDAKALERVMRYLNARAESWHKQPEEEGF